MFDHFTFYVKKELNGGLGAEMMLSRFESQDSNKRHGDIGRKVMALEFWKVFGKVSAHSLFFAGRPR